MCFLGPQFLSIDCWTEFTLVKLFHHCHRALTDRYRQKLFLYLFLWALAGNTLDLQGEPARMSLFSICPGGNMLASIDIPDRWRPSREGLDWLDFYLATLGKNPNIQLPFPCVRWRSAENSLSKNRQPGQPCVDGLENWKKETYL